MHAKTSSSKRVGKTLKQRKKRHIKTPCLRSSTKENCIMDLEKSKN